MNPITEPDLINHINEQKFIQSLESELYVIKSNFDLYSKLAIKKNEDKVGNFDFLSMEGQIIDAIQRLELRIKIHKSLTS